MWPTPNVLIDEILLIFALLPPKSEQLLTRTKAKRRLLQTFNIPLCYLFFSVFSDYLSWKLENYSLAHNRRTSYNIRWIVTIFMNLLWPYLIMLNSYNKFQSGSVKSKTFLTIRKNSDFYTNMNREHVVFEFWVSS